MKKIALLCATTALVLPGAAFAQSTGTITTDEPAIVVTGTRANRGIEGIVVPDTAKAQGVLNQDFISRQAPGQSILNTINLVPGVNFTNSDPYGSSGGNLRIRGFDGARVSLTFDGIPLNDSGNYSIFSNQQLDPELIEQVNVNLGQTDVDSPTASAAGGTVNYRTRLPDRNFNIRADGSLGTFHYRRVFGMIDSGEFWDNGPRAFASYSNTRYNSYRGPGEIYKQQFNARVYMPIGTNGDFISVAGHYNQNRNNFLRNPTLTDLRNVAGSPFPVQAAAGTTPDTPAVVGDFDRTTWDNVFAFNNFATCTKTTGGAGAQNDNSGQLPNGTPTAPAVNGSTANNIANTSSCGNFTGVRINPSNTGNIRINSRFTLADHLILTVDPSFQYVLANGGGSTALAENNFRTRGGTPASAGVDFNRDGDFLDTIRFYTPNNTNTHRYGLTASLIWDLSPDQRIRVAYTYDRANHRQTGEWGYLDANGNPESVFGGRNATPVLDATGFQIQQRNRTSVALLNQIAGQYIGHFLDRRLRVEIGVRAPFFQRDLQTFCPVQVADGFAYCTSENILARGSVPVIPGGTPAGSIPIFFNQGDSITGLNAAIRPLYAPFKAHYNFNAVLPNIGLVYDFGSGISMFGSYARGFSAPRTDNLYRAPVVTLDPEKTDAFDLGLRLRRRNFQAQATGWIINYSNRIVTSFNPDLGISIDRNVGRVKSYGVDASVSWEPIPEITLYGLASYIHAELQDNVQLSAGAACGSDRTNVPANCAPTAGKMVPETPTWQYGGRVQLNLGAMTMGAQVKHVDNRFATDVNDVISRGYTTVDGDVRFNLNSIGLPGGSSVQFNVINMFDVRYFGNISTQINAAGGPNFATGAPRTFIITLDLRYR